VKFIGAVYILKWVLPILANLSKSFQKGAINYAYIKPSINYSNDRLNDTTISEEPIKQLKQDLSGGGCLESLELVCTEGIAKDLQGLLQKYISALVKNIDKRFKSSLPVLSTSFHSHEQAEVKVVADHFFNDESEAEEFKTECRKLKYDLLSLREHILNETVDGKKGTPLKFGKVYPSSRSSTGRSSLQCLA